MNRSGKTMMKSELKKQWWRDVRWDGCSIPLGNLQRCAVAAPEKIKLPEPVGWHKYAVPSINQHGPSCCGQAWANWFEMMLRRYVGMAALQPGEQIDGYAIWKRAREMFYDGKLTGGLFLGQGFAAMVELGIVPPDTTIIDLYPHIAILIEALQSTPCVQGHIVSKGWYEPSPVNGCLDHSKLPEPRDGGHATCLMDPTRKEQWIFLASQNSWGPDYGLNGYFLMTYEYWSRCHIGEGPCTAKLPKGWEKWDGWKKHVTRNAQ